MARRRSTTSSISPAPLRVRDCVSYLLGREWKRAPTKSFLAWPPDSFAVAAKLLLDSGAYVHVVTDWPPPPDLIGEETRGTPRRYSRVIYEIGGKQWRRGESNGVASLPDAVLKWWKVVWKSRDVPVSELGSRTEVWQALMLILAAADEASAGSLIPKKPTTGFGAVVEPDESPSARAAGEAADSHLDSAIGEFSEYKRVVESLARETWPSRREHDKPDGDGDAKTTLCREISRDRLVVLPKMTTPQNGITIRNLTHHLALVPHNEVTPIWCQANAVSPERLRHSINLLVLPWPREIVPSQFQPVGRRSGADRRLSNMPRDAYDFFTFHPRRFASAELDKVRRLFAVAKDRYGPIDGVVVPEMALDLHSYDLLRQTIEEEGAVFLIGGVYESIDDQPALNAAKLWFRIDPELFHVEELATPLHWELIQPKHHRWVLNPRQVEQYGLGATLGSARHWWEYIVVRERKIHFMALHSWLALAALVCEDLARPDPVGDVIRAVGPNLLIALLQDGPQLASRWSARYCTVLADDPGCSVLAVTGRGMVQLSKRDKEPTSRVVAIWKQADDRVREIELPDDADALLLSLSTRQVKQWSADGRDCGGQTGQTVLSNYYPLRAD